MTQDSKKISVLVDSFQLLWNLRDLWNWAIFINNLGFKSMRPKTQLCQIFKEVFVHYNKFTAEKKERYMKESGKAILVKEPGE